MKKRLTSILSMILFLVSFIQILINVIPTIYAKGLIDFGVYWQALTRFLAGQDPYSGQGIPFNYPPSALLVMLPFKLFSRPTAEFILTVLSFLSLWITLWITIKLSKIKISTAHFFLILAFFTQTFPVKFTLILGQINLIVLGLAYTAIYLMKVRHRVFLLQWACSSDATSDSAPPKSQKTGVFTFFWIQRLLNKAKMLVNNGGEECGFLRAHWRYPRSCKLLNYSALNDSKKTRSSRQIIVSSFIIGLASSLKLFPLLILPLFFLTKKYFFTLITIVIFVFLNLLPGPALAQKYYLQILPNISNNISYRGFYDQSLSAFFLRLGLVPPIAKTVAFFILIGIFILILYNFYNSYNRYNHYLFSFSQIFALISIAGLFSWQHHLVFSYPLILLIYLSLWQKKHQLGLKFYLFVIAMWLVLALHFPNENSLFLSNPFLASYQTILILLMLTVSLWKKQLFRH